MFIGSLLNRVPIERVLFPQKDKAKALEEFAATTTAPVATVTAPPEQQATTTIKEAPRKATVATACVACAVNHFSTSAGLLNEGARFEKEGIGSNEVADRIAKTLQELNALERVDLTPEKIRAIGPEWERELAEEALRQSRSLRHRLETLTTIKELKEAAADTEGYYRDLNRSWWKLRVTQTGKTESELSLEDAKKLAAEEAAREVEARWESQEKD